MKTSVKTNFSFAGKKTPERKQALMGLFQGSIMTSIQMIQDMRKALGKEAEGRRAKCRQEFIRNIENSIEREKKIVKEIENWTV